MNEKLWRTWVNCTLLCLIWKPFFYLKWWRMNSLFFFYFAFSFSFLFYSFYVLFRLTNESKQTLTQLKEREIWVNCKITAELFNLPYPPSCDSPINPQRYFLFFYLFIFFSYYTLLGFFFFLLLVIFYYFHPVFFFQFFYSIFYLFFYILFLFIFRRAFSPVAFSNVGLALVGLLIFLGFGTDKRIVHHWRTVSWKQTKSKVK